MVRGASLVVLVFGIILFLFSSYLTIFDPTAGGFFTSEWSKFMATLGTISGVLLIVVRPLWQMAADDGHLINVVVTMDQDMREMAKYMKSADKVVIYSGDFSYIYQHPPLTKVMFDLAQRDELTLLSYKSREAVLASSARTRGQNPCLISQLIDAKKMQFNLPGKPKFSLVYRRGEEVLLYRHRSDGIEYVTIFKANKEMAKELVRILNMLTDGISAQAMP
ncbi:hypothetical protein [Porphyrobacter sp. HT-58-2]|uniref:hypothetical protein n=1 Tax=Porphyrobacter sp. HT-58-2 TaxID=2023229 RepID=UPI0011B0BAA3|nr:hypothetical protein [Porphyrobacter sp. HT-58-2]